MHAGSESHAWSPGSRARLSAELGGPAHTPHPSPPALSVRLPVFSAEASAVLPYAPAAVFAALAGVESSPRWQGGVRGVRRAGASRAGLCVAYHALGVRHTLRTWVTACEPPARFAYRAENDAFALDVALEVTPAFGGARLPYQLRLTVHAVAARNAEDHPPEEVFAVEGDAAARQAAEFRRLLARRAPRDLARLEHDLAVRLRPAVALPGAPAGAPGHR